ncbi:nitroreductase family protein [Sphingobium yanoikuyae]|uniref:Nitroreductase family protein n=1 Tax=Sphingobium yanoikuyae TaxID=13690 RepID=A0A9X7U6K4_SPHYA|nr:nitroreductase family protein [Sphingobium yanoikuyae]QNG43970.1 nitroreductase family protein [Sphingobium yanoikuyae]
MTNQLLATLKNRRSQYQLGKPLSAPPDEVTSLIQEAIRLSPSSFNSQSSRAVILYGEQHEKLWKITTDNLRRIVPAEAFDATRDKITSFAEGSGTVLFYEDIEVVKGLQEQFALYAENFPVWSEQSSGMAQLAVWTALADADIGASLQHYNPLIDDDVAEEWDIPASWKLRAQMPFGTPLGKAPEKSFMDDAARFKVFG